MSELIMLPPSILLQKAKQFSLACSLAQPAGVETSGLFSCLHKPLPLTQNSSCCEQSFTVSASSREWLWATLPCSQYREVPGMLCGMSSVWICFQAPRVNVHGLGDFLSVSHLIALLLFPCVFGVSFISNFAAPFLCLTANYNQLFMLMELVSPLPC